MANIIFYFTGTGNSLKVAKDIAEGLSDTTLVSMGKPHKMLEKYDSIGFVYPVYCGGLPGAVRQFVKSLDITANKNAYFFAVCTSGATSGGLNNVSKMLAEKGGKLSYGENVKCFANYICMYPMADGADSKARAQSEATKKVVAEIKAKTVKSIPKNSIMALLNGWFVKVSLNKDKGYNVSTACNSCGTCEKVCPVKNIKMQSGKPEFLHHCEQCVACVQWCPKQAINFKNKTQSRGRYHHLAIKVEDIIGGQK